MEDVQDSLAPVPLPSICFSKTMIGAGPALRLKAAYNSRSMSTSEIPTARATSLNMPANDAGINVSQMGSLQKSG